MATGELSLGSGLEPIRGLPGTTSTLSSEREKGSGRSLVI